MEQKKNKPNILLNAYKEVVSNAEEGLAQGIPLKSTKLTEMIGGVTPKTYYVVTAESGVGKTRFALDTFLLQPIEHTLKKGNYRQEKDVHVLLYSLEMPLDRTLAMIMARHLYETGKLDTDYSDSDIFGSNGVPPKDLLDAMKSPAAEKYLNNLNKHLSFYTDKNPEKMFRDISKVCYDKSKVVGTDAGGNKLYKFNNKKFMLIVIIDHISNFGSKEGGINRDAVYNVSKGLMELRNKFGITPVVLQQANPSMENILLPSQENTRDSKDPFIDADVVIALGSPMKSNMQTYQHKNDVYQVIPNFNNGGVGLENTIRVAGAMKGRFSGGDSRAVLLFKGGVMTITDMPPADKIEYERKE